MTSTSPAPPPLLPVELWCVCRWICSRSIWAPATSSPRSPPRAAPPWTNRSCRCSPPPWQLKLAQILRFYPQNGRFKASAANANPVGNEVLRTSHQLPTSKKELKSWEGQLDSTHGPDFYRNLLAARREASPNPETDRVSPCGQSLIFTQLMASLSANS